MLKIRFECFMVIITIRQKQEYNHLVSTATHDTGCVESVDLVHYLYDHKLGLMHRLDCTCMYYFCKLWGMLNSVKRRRIKLLLTFILGVLDQGSEVGSQVLYHSTIQLQMHTQNILK